MAEKYSDKLRDPRWQKMRLKIMERDGFECKNCGSTSETLNVHHKWYLRKTEPWDYPEDALTTLCEACHKVEEKNNKAWDEILIEFKKYYSLPEIIQIQEIRNHVYPSSSLKPDLNSDEIDTLNALNASFLTSIFLFIIGHKELRQLSIEEFYKTDSGKFYENEYRKYIKPIKSNNGKNANKND